MDKVLFLVSEFLLVWGLRLQSDPASASKGNKYASVGMLIAIISAIIMPIENSYNNYSWISFNHFNSRYFNKCDLKFDNCRRKSNFQF